MQSFSVTQTCQSRSTNKRAAEQELDRYVEMDVAPTIAEGIAIGKPMRSEEILEYVYKYDVRSIHAREDEILDARAALAEKGVYCEHTTAANYAAYLNYCR